MWVFYACCKVLEHEKLQWHWAVVLDDKTELWPREDWLVQQHWQL